jgi:FtsH-binding integral membrane protein
MNMYRPQVAVRGEPISLRAVMQQVYVWMFAGLAVSAVTAVVFATTGLTLALGPMFYVLIFAEIGLVWYISARIGRMASSTATQLFLLYAALNGATLSVIFYVYSLGDIYLALFSAGAMFGAMSIVGYTTDIDLSRFRGILFMALIGLIIASIVNIFLASSALYWVISYGGVLIFVALTAYDTQWIKRTAMSLEAQGVGNGEAAVRRVAILGALHLYLDFINLFLYILRIVGGRRN